MFARDSSASSVGTGSIKYKEMDVNLNDLEPHLIREKLDKADLIFLEVAIAFAQTLDQNNIEEENLSALEKSLIYSLPKKQSESTLTDTFTTNYFSFTLLPDELKIKILSFLSFNELSKLHVVSKEFSSLIKKTHIEDKVVFFPRYRFFFINKEREKYTDIISNLQNISTESSKVLIKKLSSTPLHSIDLPPSACQKLLLSFPCTIINIATGAIGFALILSISASYGLMLDPSNPSYEDTGSIPNSLLLIGLTLGSFMLVSAIALLTAGCILDQQVYRNKSQYLNDVIVSANSFFKIKPKPLENNEEPQSVLVV